MNLRIKKELAKRALNVGKERIVFVKERLEEIKEAITKQDVQDLYQDGAIKIREVKGRKKVVKRKRARGTGKIKKKVNRRKKDYVIMVRKQRAYVKDLVERKKLEKKDAKEIRKKIRNKKFRSKAHLKDYVGGLNK